MFKLNLLPNTQLGILLQTHHWTDSEYRSIRDNYDRFLNQKLELWQIVPCDGHGNPLRDPGLFPSSQQQEYRKAKDCCLFEGFYLTTDFENKPVIRHANYSTQVFCRLKDYGGRFVWNFPTTATTVEHLTELRLIPLSQTAIKSIYGKLEKAV